MAPKFQTEKTLQQALEIDLFRSIIKQAKPLGLSGVKLTGGEPLMHPEIEDILEHIRLEELRLTLETNGLLLTLGLAKKIAECKNPFVSVSLDGANANTHEWIRGVEGSFENAKEGVRNLVKVGLNPQIILTVMRRNKDQMENVVRLAESLGAGSVKFNLMHPIERGEKMHEAEEALTIEELVKLGRWVETTLSDSTNLRLFYHHPPAFRPLGKMFGNNKTGNGTCGIMGILGVLADGSYALCGIGESVQDLVFGHAAKDRIEDVWYNTSVLQELREGMPDGLEGVCGDCLMKSRCLGSCVAQNYYLNRNIFAPFWYCEEARSQGLFPESRLRPEAKNCTKNLKMER
jgi:SynChlorMet cassette radical SAM/SPASM protein ScmF